MIRNLLCAITTALVFGSLAHSAPKLERTKAPAGAGVYFLEPKDGSTVKGPVHIVFGLTSMGVAPAGTKNPLTGHHHIVIDQELPDPTLPIPATANIRHFGGGQTEATLELSKGKHTLQLILGDHQHLPFDPVISSTKITITVE